MEIILLERIAKLGQMGDVVNVKTGYARNYLLPQGKALRATEANIAYFNTKKTELEARNLERKNEAEKIAEKINGVVSIVVRSAGETGQLYGSVAARDIVQALSEDGFKIEKSQVELNNPIKIIGMHDVRIILHPEVSAQVTMNVARSEDEAKRQAKGEDLTLTEEQKEEIIVDKEAVFEKPEDVKLEDINEKENEERQIDENINEETEPETETETETEKEKTEEDPKR